MFFLKLKFYIEKDWNTESSLSRNPYYFSKKEAEEKAWNFMDEKKPPFSLVVMNVSFKKIKKLTNFLIAIFGNWTRIESR
jgi:hypothetical protein